MKLKQKTGSDGVDERTVSNTSAEICLLAELFIDMERIVVAREKEIGFGDSSCSCLESLPDLLFFPIQPNHRHVLQMLLPTPATAR